MPRIISKGKSGFKWGGVKPYGYTRKSNLNRTVKRILDRNTEFQIKNTNSTGSSIVQDGAVINLLNITQGDGVDNRSGNAITVKNVTVNVAFSYNASVSPSVNNDTQVYKCALIWDRQPDGVTPTYNQIYDISTSDPALAQRNMSARQDRFTVLWEEFSTVMVTTQYTYNGVSVVAYELPFDSNNMQFKNYVDIGKRIKNLKTRYNGNASVPTTGALYLVYAASSNLSVAGDNGSIAYTCKVRFSDI